MPKINHHVQKYIDLYCLNLRGTTYLGKHCSWMHVCYFENISQSESEGLVEGQRGGLLIKHKKYYHQPFFGVGNPHPHIPGPKQNKFLHHAVFQEWDKDQFV